MGHLSSRYHAVDRRYFVKEVAATGALLAVMPRVAFGQTTPSDVTVPDGAGTWVKYNINTVSADQILAIPNAGDQMTHEFDEYRPYATIGQFRGEIGKYVDEDVVRGYERYVFVPVDPTQPDADTFAQLPGLDRDEAGKLADGGPYEDDAAFLAALADLVSAEQVQLAHGFLASAASDTVTVLKYNLNTVTPDQILSIPNTGDRMVGEFQEYRPYATIEQFRQEIGKYVDASVVAGYEDYLFVPVNPDDASEETLMQLPGVSADIASTLAGARPFGSNDAFLAALADHVSDEQARLAAAFLVQS